MTDSRFLGVAVGGSFAFHLGACALAIVLLASKDVFSLGRLPSAPPQAPPEEITVLTPEMILVERTAETPSETERRRGAFVDASGMRAVDDPDPGARLEADRNTVARSESEPSPDPAARADLPFQKGRDIPSIHVVESTATDGVGFESAGATLTGDGDLPAPERAPEGSHLGSGADEAVRNAMKGSAPKGEEVSVTAVQTARAEYETAVVEALKSSKNLVVAGAALPFGDATVRFFITRDGRKEDLRFAGQPSDPRIGDMALSTVLKASLPALPDQVFEDLPDGRLPFTYEFISY